MCFENISRWGRPAKQTFDHQDLVLSTPAIAQRE